MNQPFKELSVVLTDQNVRHNVPEGVSEIVRALPTELERRSQSDMSEKGSLDSLEVNRSLCSSTVPGGSPKIFSKT